ncbi:hypothetical protein [Microbacterium sp.]|uniref:hypothetical protein n=1 Tax=Microbacterium sp. TaxID=51671 RepID=UPI0039E5D436
MTAPTYAAVHKRLTRTRGSAVGRRCEHPDCDRRATGWALVGHPTHIVLDRGKSKRLSTDLDAYAPTCTRHNAQRDHGGTWALCRNGHARIVWGADATGYCRGCARDRSRRTHAKTSTPTGADHAQQGTITEQNGGQS